MADETAWQLSFILCLLVLVMVDVVTFTHSLVIVRSDTTIPSLYVVIVILLVVVFRVCLCCLHDETKVNIKTNTCAVPK